MKRVLAVMAVFVSVTWMGCGEPLPEEASQELMSLEEVSQAPQELAVCPSGYISCRILAGTACTSKEVCCDGNVQRVCYCFNQRFVC
ncbi:hypothetical protein [Myxococcus stipitatus]|uniref:hypothetical protein n=1 Tax=Myxococcus stipitatus TaxID=83455 RepID=UPI0030CC5A6C